MSIEKRIERLEDRRPRMLLAVVGEGEDPADVAARCYAAAGASPRQPVVLVHTGVPRPQVLR